MEIEFDLSLIFGDEHIQRLDQNALKRLNPRRYWAVKGLIDGIGALSAKAQGLKKMLTSYEKVLDSEDNQVVYISWEQHTSNKNWSRVIGVLKIGYKNLYLLDDTSVTFTVKPLCVLDFFVYSSYQRKGFGRKLFDFMLKSEKTCADIIAVDKPSVSLLNFLSKHYHLENPCWQMNNFVIFPAFFLHYKPPTKPKEEDVFCDEVSDERSDFEIASKGWPVKIVAAEWSPNGKKLAVVNSERLVLLFDDNGSRRDKFATKPSDPKYGKKSYSVTSAVFSPDSTRLAVGQTDNIVFVYRIGETWEEKKVICNKFSQSSSVTALKWPKEEILVLGLVDGKVRLASCKNNKCSTLYKTETFVTQISVHPARSSFISGHLDGSIIHYSFELKSQSKIITHPCSPYALIFMANGVLAAGCDRRILWYSENGKLLQQFDCGADKSEKDFYSAVSDPSGQSAIIASFDRVRLISWNSERGALEESDKLDIPHLYTVTALGWKPDGPSVIVGTICGLVISVDCCVKRSILKNRYQLTYISPGHIAIRDVETGQKTNLRSDGGLAIENIKILDSGQYAVGYTSKTLLIANIASNQSSEVQWQSAGNEKFLFNSNVCIIINAGELSFVQYGVNEILGWVRTEFVSSHLLSVVLTSQGCINGAMKKMVAYLLDANFISVVDLTSNLIAYQTTHTAPIDWLELSETATKLLYRDQKADLTLVDLETKRKTTILIYCSYVQWVPLSDVIVAQSGDQLCVWYQLENPNQMSTMSIKGDVETVVRDEIRTEVIVQEPTAKVAYELDQTLIEFETAVRNYDYKRAIDFLENRQHVDNYFLWKQLAQVAFLQNQLLVTQRCYAALNDIPRVYMLDIIHRLTNKVSKITAADPLLNYEVRAKLALINRNFEQAEQIYLENGKINKAIEMYQKLHKWEKALDVAKARNFAEYDTLKINYIKHLLDTNQFEKAAEIYESDGDYIRAIDLYLKENYVGQAADVLLKNNHLISRTDLVDKVIGKLLEHKFSEKAGDLFEKLQDYERCLECYQNAACYSKALQLARSKFPEKVVTIEEEWGNSLMNEGKYDAAINHFLESGKNPKALEAATLAKQWGKAAQIADALEDTSVSKEFYGKIAEHYAETGNLERAEMFYVEAGQHKKAIEMYNKANLWGDSYRLASEFLGREESNELYERLAIKMESTNHFEDAAVLYESIGQINKAEEMYKKANKFEELINIAKKYYPERLQETYRNIGTALEDSGDLKLAEEYFLKIGDWKSAVNMYKAAEKWNDAYRLAKQEGNELALKQVAFLWAKSLGGDAAVKLLRKLNLFDEIIEVACQNRAFELAFEICRIGNQTKLPFVHLQNAIYLEEAGKYGQAEEHYIQGQSPKEAVLMYSHLKQWDKAEDVARQHCKDALTEVYVEKAKIAMQNEDYAEAESYLLRADRADIILQHYKQRNLWREALRIAKDYLPSSLAQIQEEYDEVQLRSGAKGALSYIEHGKDCEAQGEYYKALECYLKINETLTDDISLIVTVLLRAGELIAKFLPAKDAKEKGQEVAQRLLRYSRFDEAAELSLRTNCPENAINAYIYAQDWAKAKKVASEFAPDMESFVDEKYKEMLRSGERLEELINIDTVSAINLLVEKGLWEKALETAKKKSHRPLLDKYLAMYAAQLISQKRFLDAIKTLERYEASLNPNNFNIYRILFEEVYAESDDTDTEMFSKWAHLRNMFHLICTDSNNSNDSDAKELFKKYLEVAHYQSVSTALLDYSNPLIQTIRQSICVSLLRYADVLHVEKAFYEAGNACKEQGKEKLAFVFLNHFLDIYDAIEHQDLSSINTSVFGESDIPQDFSLPDKHLISVDAYEDVKEWVLAASVGVKTDEDNFTNSNDVLESGLMPLNGIRQKLCIISGYPAGNDPKVFGTSERVANRENWNQLVIAQKTKPTDNVNDVLQFISRWTGTPISMVA